MNRRETYGRRKHRRGSALYKDWIIPVLIIEPPKHPEALRDIVPLLRRLRRAFGARSVALLLNVRSSDVRSWHKRRRPIPPEMRRRVLDLHDVFTRLFRLYRPPAAFHWLSGSERLLNGRRPLDVISTEGAGPIVAALREIESFGCRRSEAGHCATERTPSFS
jgi:hypothetical protein